MISAVAPNHFNPTEAVVRGTACKLKATNCSLPKALISLPLSHTHTETCVYSVEQQQVIGCFFLSLSVFLFYIRLLPLRPVVLNLKQDLYSFPALRCWARSSGCQDLSHIYAVTQSFLSAVCLCLRGASHELSNEVLTITFLSRCCLWFYGKRETCMLKKPHMVQPAHTEQTLLVVHRHQTCN